MGTNELPEVNPRCLAQLQGDIFSSISGSISTQLDHARQPTQFSDLDDFVVEKILSLLEPSQRRRKRLVCQFWKNLIENRIGLEVRINVINKQLMKFVSRCVLTTIHLTKFNSTSRSKNNSRTCGDPGQWLRYPHRLRSIVTDQFIDATVLEEILQHCHNVKHLRVSIKSLIATPVATSTWKVGLRSLQSLQLTQNIYSATRDCDLALEILKMHLPELKYITLRFQVYQATMDVETVSSLQSGLLQFLKQSTALRQVYIELKGRAVAPLRSALRPTSLVSPREMDDALRSTKALSTLEHLCVRLPQTCGLDFWELLYSHQESLEKLLIHLPDLSLSMHAQTIMKNSRTLKLISLQGSTDDELHAIDFSCLSQCLRLTNLHLESCYKDDRAAFQSIYFANLPETLIRIDIAWIKIRTSQIAQLTRLPNLRYLALVGCGEEDEYGVTVHMLSELFSLRQLEELFIYNVNHHFIQFCMRRLVQILQHLQRSKVRAHVREGAFYIVNSRNNRDHRHSWYWGASLNTHAPTYFVNPYIQNDSVHDIV